MAEKIAVNVTGWQGGSASVACEQHTPTAAVTAADKLKVARVAFRMVRRVKFRHWAKAATVTRYPVAVVRANQTGNLIVTGLWIARGAKRKAPQTAIFQRIAMILIAREFQVYRQTSVDDLAERAGLNWYVTQDLYSELERWKRKGAARLDAMPHVSTAIAGKYTIVNTEKAAQVARGIHARLFTQRAKDWVKERAAMIASRTRPAGT